MRFCFELLHFGKRLACLVGLCLLLLSCSRFGVHDAVQIATDPTGATAQRLLTAKAISAATHPEQTIRDIKEFEQNFQKILKAFEDAVSGKWGRREVKKPSRKVYVKYTQNYKSRATVDFDTGLITVETVDDKQPEKSLREAIVTTLLTPDDPRAVDLYSAREIQLGPEPYLYGEVKDHEGEFVRWEWRAGRYADYLVKHSLKSRSITDNGRKKLVRYVSFQMVKDHAQVRAAKFRPLVEQNARRFGVSKNLVYAIMQTESNFNPFAVSSAPAFGLMQIVPSTAGQDISRYLTGKATLPSREFLFEPKNNILYGTCYLHMLDTKYLDKIKNPLSREYCIISAYNGGAGNVLRTFSSDRDEAVRRINAMHPLDVYNALHKKHRYAETRRYIWKVVQAKKDFVNI